MTLCWFQAGVDTDGGAANMCYETSSLRLAPTGLLFKVYVLGVLGEVPSVVFLYKK